MTLTGIFILAFCLAGIGFFLTHAYVHDARDIIDQAPRRVGLATWEEER